MRVILNERRGDVATVHVVAVADLETDSIRTATLEAHATFGWSNLTKHSTLADVTHVPGPFIECCKHHHTTFNRLTCYASSSLLTLGHSLPKRDTRTHIVNLLSPQSYTCFILILSVILKLSFCLSHLLANTAF